MNRRIEGLDLLRGIAVALTILGHAFPDRFGSAGIVGVIVFFTLSGYLITGVLLNDIDRRGAVGYARFYRNRALRLLPALYAMLLVLTLVTAVLNPVGDRSGLLRGLILSVTYTTNLPIAQGLGSIAHLWTLATEEQFYLVWPLVLTLAVRSGRLRTVTVAVGLAAYAVCAGTVVAAHNPHHLYPLPTSWAITLVIGALLQIATRGTPVAGRPTWRSALGVGLLVGMGLLPSETDHAWAYVIGGPLVSLVSCVLIIELRRWARVPSLAILRAFHLLGVVSYAAYLWNYPITVWLAYSGVSGMLLGVLSLTLTVTAAATSWVLVEGPVAAWRRRLDTRSAPDAVSTLRA